MRLAFRIIRCRSRNGGLPIAPKRSERSIELFGDAQVIVRMIGAACARLIIGVACSLTIVVMFGQRLDRVERVADFEHLLG